MNNLREHKYKSSGSTLMDPLIQPYWNYISEIISPKLAPNMITLIALFCNIAGFISIFYYSGSNGTQEGPWFAYVFCGLMLFVYQTLDAVDGKQARKLNLQSPLGELFDHGMDSISNFLGSTALAMTLLCGNEPALMLSTVMFSMILFYVTHWASFATGTLHFSKFDVTEVQWTGILTFILTGILGSSIWNKIIIFGFNLRQVYLTCAYIAGSNTFIRNIKQVYQASNSIKNPGFSVFSPGANILVITFLSLMVGMKNNLYIKQPVYFNLYIGIITAKITNKLIVGIILRLSSDLVGYFSLLI